MKKISKIILTFVLCLSLVIYIPIDSRASGLGLECKTITSVDGYYSNVDIQLMQKRLTGYNPSLAGRSISDIENALSSFVPLGGNWSKYFITYWASEDFLLVEEFDTSKIHEGIFLCANNDSLPASNVDLNNRPATTRLNVQVLFGGEYRRESTFNFTNNSWSSSYTTSSPTFVNTLIQPTLYIDGNIPMYCKWDIIQSGGSYSEDMAFYLSDKSAYTNFLSRDLPYETSSGSIVDPSPEVVYEGNNNHLYFKNCEIGFCYPKTSSNPASFGGAYFYVKYEVDDWIVSHISEYNLVFYAEADIGNNGLTNTIRYEIALDPDGCITIPFSRLWISDITSKGFTVYVTDSYVEDNFYKAYLYSMSAASFSEFGENHAYYEGTPSILGALSALGSGGIDAFMFYIENSNVEIYTNLTNATNALSVKYNPYLITAFTLIESDGESSGLFEMEFDLVSGTEDVTDTSGLVNPDPFVPSDSDTPEYMPPVPSGGNSTTPTVIVNTGGTWQGIFNGVFHDDSLQNLKETVDAYPQVPNKKFWDYFLVFKDNAFLDATSDFFGALPNELSALLISSIGIIGVFAIYRFVRRR